LKKLLLLGFFILAYSFYPAITTAQIPYQQGDQGQDVVIIQQKLSKLGLFDGNFDGKFGPKTTNAVKIFQKNNNLVTDGIVGEETFRALLEPTSEISRGNSRNNVSKIINYSMKFIGVPYVFGGTSPNGFDCSGYVQYVFAKNGIILPRTADIQFTQGKLVSKNDLTPGDLVYFTTYAPGASHVGIYIGDNKFINAQSSKGVAIANLSNYYWASRYFGAKRILI